MRSKDAWTTVRAATCSACLVLALGIASSCDKTDRLKKGMTVAEVEQIMGKPTRVESERRRFRQALPGDTACADTAATILVFEVGGQKHVLVGVDRSRVICVVKSQDVMH